MLELLLEEALEELSADELSAELLAPPPPMLDPEVADVDNPPPVPVVPELGPPHPATRRKLMDVRFIKQKFMFE